MNVKEKAIDFLCNTHPMRTGYLSLTLELINEIEKCDVDNTTCIKINTDYTVKSCAALVIYKNCLEKRIGNIVLPYEENLPHVYMNIDGKLQFIGTAPPHSRWRL